ncbi:MAG: hypothetical protein HC923_03635 [Myxococcales bacterium]|nr:hypothetical protein [Myxococcales bacterium]
MTQIAETFDGKVRPDCVFERATEDGSFYVKAELRNSRLNVIANFPFGVVCTSQVPCYMVVGVRVNSCNPLDPKLVYVDGTGEVRAVLRKVRHTPGQQKAPDDPALCESEAYVHGYITAPRLPNEPRRFAATIELK